MSRLRHTWLLLLVGALAAAGPGGLRLLHTALGHGHCDAVGRSCATAEGGAACCRHGGADHAHHESPLQESGGDDCGDHSRQLPAPCGSHDGPQQPCDDDCSICRHLALATTALPDAVGPAPCTEVVSTVLPLVVSQTPPPAPPEALAARPPPAC